MVKKASTGAAVQGPFPKMPIWIGIDPGKTGALAILTQGSLAWACDFTDFLHMFSMLQRLQVDYDVRCVALEHVWGMKGNAAKGDTTFMQHVGGWKALLDVVQLPWVEVRPQTWMHRRVRAKTSRKDKPSIEYVQQHYPAVGLTGPRGGIKDGRADAICLAEYARDCAGLFE